MTTAVLHAPNDLRLERRATPEVRTGWVRVGVEAAGICGTDVAVYTGAYPAQLPVVLGHEFAGRVLEVGDGVEGIRVGDTVAVEGGWACGECAECRMGRRSLCLSRVLLGRTVDGCFTEQIVVPAEIVYPVGPTVPARSAQAMTTLATTLHAADRAGDLSGARVSIVGPGHAGLLLLQVARLRGAASVTVVGRRESRLAFARRLGADEVVSLDEFPSWVADAPHREHDVSFEASGTARGLAEAMEMTRTGGRVVAYGIITGSLEEVPGHYLYNRELAIIGSKGAAGSYHEAIPLLTDGRIQTEMLVTHTLPLRDAERGFQLMLDRSGSALRVVLEPDGISHKR
jgi:2-desacetyl-2-hydroxyethyl bacteriochlorophyllide A dehydrogenase